MILRGKITLNVQASAMNMAEFGVSNNSLSVGNTSYGSIRYSLNNYAIHELLNERNIARNLAVVMRTGRKLQDYGDPSYEQKITLKLQSLVDRPDKMSRMIGKLVSGTVSELRQFNEAYYAIQKELYDGLAMSMMTTYLEDDYFFKIVLRIEEVSRTRRIYLPNDLLARLEKRMIEVLDEQARQLESDLLDMGREESERPVKAPFMMHVFGVGYASGRSKGLIKRWRRREMSDARKYLDQLNADLQSGNISIRTLSLLLNRLDSMVETDRMVRDLAHETIVLLDQTRKTASETAMALEKFHSLFNSEPEVASMYKWLKDMEAWGQSHGRRIMDRQRENTSQLLGRVKKMRADLTYHIDYLRRITGTQMPAAA